MSDRCRDAVELLTDYLDGVLAADVAALLDDHLRACEGCQTVLDQWRTTAGLAARLDAADLAGLDPYIRNRFLAVLTELRRR